MTGYDGHALKRATRSRRPRLTRNDTSALEAVALLCGLALVPVIAALLAAMIAPATADPAPGGQAPADTTTAPPGRTLDHGSAIGETTALSTTTGRRWTPVTNATITLAGQGVYEVTQQVRGQFVTAQDRLTRAWIVSRLFNVTTDTPVGESDLLVAISAGRRPLADDPVYGSTATGHIFIQVDRPITLRLEAMQAWDVETVRQSRIITDPDGFTKLLYKRLT
ncbi:hypothetical protein AGRA3207_001937 [Actinomadura graeca]|uniref:Uncharacterized protein n=1 Tax=Actinomadura graeca TaxID=2750812 RepID=A0ABX8QT13_9ACTN|nr:hypothetical protein [Actinomadura graeca]QXJ21114.1 hypothetical protein AGRA3207_001937 [Actinomadura graeca]